MPTTQACFVLYKCIMLSLGMEQNKKRGERKKFNAAAMGQYCTVSCQLRHLCSLGLFKRLFEGSLEGLHGGLSGGLLEGLHGGLSGGLLEGLHGGLSGDCAGKGFEIAHCIGLHSITAGSHLMQLYLQLSIVCN